MCYCHFNLFDANLTLAHSSHQDNVDRANRLIEFEQTARQLDRKVAAKEIALPFDALTASCFEYHQSLNGFWQHFGDEQDCQNSPIQ
jgi:hypothetical protein